jgi:acyl-coenzyme A thioesterase PaaI-like protein
LSFGNGITILRANGESRLLRQDYDDNVLRPGRTVSGPTRMAFADCAMYVLLLSAIGRVGLAVTTNVEYQFPAQGRGRTGRACGGTDHEARPAIGGR